MAFRIPPGRNGHHSAMPSKFVSKKRATFSKFLPLSRTRSEVNRGRSASPCGECPSDLLFFEGRIFSSEDEANQLIIPGSIYRIMATTTKRNRGSDRGRVSSQKHEISYAGSKLGKGGAGKVRRAKQSLGRKTSRKAVRRR